MNWASPRHSPALPWVGPAYAAAGYADQLDYLITGCYYPEVTIAEARGGADYVSVEAAAELSVRVVLGDVPVTAGLFLMQYQGDEERYKAAVRMARSRSAGVMLFDLCYVDGYDWWAATREALA